MMQDDDRALEGLHPLSLAMGLLERIELPATKGLMQVVAASIEVVGKSRGLTHAAATDLLLEKARTARRAGVRVDRFWFEDGKYREDEHGRSVNQAEQRQSDAVRNTARGVGRALGIVPGGDAGGAAPEHD